MSPPKPVLGEWTVMDVIERLFHAGPDAHLYIHIDIAGKNYDVNLANVRVEGAGGELPAHVIFEGVEAKTDTPIEKTKPPFEGELNEELS